MNTHTRARVSSTQFLIGREVKQGMDMVNFPHDMLKAYVDIVNVPHGMVNVSMDMLQES
jgi:hypothetical protein